MAIHRGWGRRSTRVINCNSTFFCHSLERGVIFPMHILSSTVQFICGVVFMQFFTSVLFPTPSFAFDSSISGLVQKTSPRVKLVYISNCTFFVFRCCVFTFLANTLACVPTSPIFIYKTVFFLCTLALDAFFHFFPLPARTTR